MPLASQIVSRKNAIEKVLHLEEAKYKPTAAEISEVPHTNRQRCPTFFQKMIALQRRIPVFSGTNESHNHY